MTDRVEIFEVGPRDGLQNEARIIPTQDKIALIDALSAAGFRRIEVASFVSPKWVPQMADGAEVLGGITRAPGVSYAALVPNERGLERAIAAKPDEIAVFASASEGFSKANLNCTIEESFARFAPVVAGAQAAGLRVRGYVSCVTDCPFDGATPPDTVADVAARLHALGCYEVSLGETLGKARPEAVAAMLGAVCDVVPADSLAGHFHDTAGRALDNIDVALQAGLRVFDASVGGLGGCPYAPGAAGNVATEAVMEFVTARGGETGLDPDKVALAADMARALRKGEGRTHEHA
ncbi:hydroxymethylglutaryl-CoA lyase [Tropicimonas sp. S265A]|uniref:hydroxymethylglutaryl-CoA lyase n=1 Tax=Tropicimonas sp. S265A TaxID=3415134 RepID=UPI003C7AA026